MGFSKKDGYGTDYGHVLQPWFLHKETKRQNCEMLIVRVNLTTKPITDLQITFAVFKKAGF